jgi:glutaredoxin
MHWRRFIVSLLELYGSSTCPYTQEMRESLEWRNRDFREYDVETDKEANARLRALSGSCSVPVIVEDGKVIQIGWQGRSCIVGPA